MVATAHAPVVASHFTCGTAGDICTFTSPQKAIVVTNRGAVNVSFTLDGSTPTDLGADCYFVPAGGTKVVQGSGITVVYLIAPSNCLVSVEGFAEGIGAALSSTSGGGGAVTNGGTFAVQDTQVVTEDVASVGAEKMFMAGTVRRDTAASSAGTDGDYATANTDASGRLWVAAVESGTWTVQIGNTPNTSPILATLVASATGSLTPYHLVSAATTNATVVKASAGSLNGWYIYNSNAAARKIAFHDTASTPTAGASIFFTLFLPGASAANVFSPSGLTFATGIAFTTVTDLADNGTTAVAANDLNINLFYK